MRYLSAVLLACLLPANAVAQTLSSCLNQHDFSRHWTIESESPDSRLRFFGDTLEVISPKGLTLWRNERMSGRTVIEYDACLMDQQQEGDRVSDLNCFWMASDPSVADGSVFTRLSQRQGVFKRCYTLQLYYLGYGGNSNSTTRFRRYHGEGTLDDAASLPPESLPAVLTEYTDAAHLNQPNRWRHIRLEADGMRIRYYIDGECLVDYRDPDPLTSGYFGLRTTWSRLRVTNFTCSMEPLSEDPLTGITLHWVDRPQLSSGAVRFGVPFARGEAKAGDLFCLDTMAVDAYPLAYWPDGSVKWMGFAGSVLASSQYTLRKLSAREVREQQKRQSRRDARSPQYGLSAEQTASQLIVHNGDSRLFFPITPGASSVIDSLVFQQRNASQHIRLVAQSVGGSMAVGVLDSVSIERQTDHLIVVRSCGHVDGLPVILRFYIHAGSPEVRVVYTMIYNRGPEQASLQCLGLQADVPLHGQLYNRHVAFSTDAGQSLWHEPVQPVTGRRTLSLDGNGRGSDDLYRSQMRGEALPEPSAFSEFNQGLLHDWASWDAYRLSQPLDKGFSIRKRARSAQLTPWIGTFTGTRSTGGCFVGEAGTAGGDDAHGMVFAMHDFWQSYPSTLLIEGATSHSATVTMWLWSPEAEAMDLRHYDTQAHGLEASYEDVQEGMSSPLGIARTSVIMLQPTAGYPGDSTLNATFMRLTRQPQLVCSPQYLHAQRAFGVWSLPDTLYRSTEDELTHWSRFYIDQIDQRSWYGFWNYGDVMHAFDQVRNEWRYDVGGFAWDNTELASNMFLWYNFLRTGDASLWHAAVAMTRHTSEVDVYHDGPYQGLGSRHNVSHWGCGSKEARISQAVWNRFYYYLSGGDERLGELMTAQRDLDTLLYRLDPMRLAQPRGLYPCTAPARLRIGPDWLAYAANWMTEYERTLNPRYWQKLLAGMQSISSLPHGIFSGPKALGYDPATGIISWEGDSTVTDTNHLLQLMGGFEFMGELLLMPEVPDSWQQTWQQYCAEYRDQAIAKKKNGYAIARLPAFAHWHAAETGAAAAQRRHLLEAALTELHRGAQSSGSFSTNGVSTWSLDAIYMLEVCPPPLQQR